MIFKIKAYILGALETGKTTKDLKDILGVSDSMLSQYKGGGYYPSLAVAMKVYRSEGLTLHPFSADSLRYEIEKGIE